MTGDILESARLAVQYLEGKTEKDFYDDTKSQDALIRRFEVIGEAARRISDEGQSAYPGLPWMAKTVLAFWKLYGKQMSASSGRAKVVSP